MKLNNKGFSLVEILITVGLIGTLTAIAVPSYQKYQADAKKGVADSIIYTAIRTIQLQQSLGQPATQNVVANTIKSKGQTISIIIAGNNAGEIGAAEDAFCVSIPEGADKAYPAVCGAVSIDTAATCTDSNSGGGTCNSAPSGPDDCPSPDNGTTICAYVPAVVSTVIKTKPTEVLCKAGGTCGS